MKNEFAIKANSFKDYEKLKYKLEEMGYKYCETFTKFNEIALNYTNCFYFSDGFNGGITPNAFAFSGSTDKTKLFKYSEEALTFAKSNLGPALELTLKELVQMAAREYNVSVDDIKIKL